MIAGYYWSRI